jgi:sulfur-carrier protein
MNRIRVALPTSLRALAGVEAEVGVEVSSHPTVALVLDALEAAHPALRGTIRDQMTGERRAFMRYFACGRDISNRPPDEPLPEAIAAGTESLRIVGAISGG